MNVYFAIVNEIPSIPTENSTREILATKEIIDLPCHGRLRRKSKCFRNNELSHAEVIVSAYGATVLVFFRVPTQGAENIFAIIDLQPEG